MSSSGRFNLNLSAKPKANWARTEVFWEGLLSTIFAGKSVNRGVLKNLGYLKQAVRADSGFHTRGGLGPTALLEPSLTEFQEVPFGMLGSDFVITQPVAPFIFEIIHVPAWREVARVAENVPVE